MAKLADDAARDRLLTADEAAAVLRVSRRYVLRLAREGAIERVKPTGRKSVLFPESGLVDYIESGRQAPVRVGATAARLIDRPALSISGPAPVTRRRFP